MITRYDPFREALSLRRAMDQLFEQSFVHPSLMRELPWEIGLLAAIAPTYVPDQPVLLWPISLQPLK